MCLNTEAILAAPRISVPVHLHFGFLVALLRCVWFLFLLWFCATALLFVLSTYTLFKQLPDRPAFYDNFLSDVFASRLYFIWWIRSFLLTMLSLLCA